MTVIAALYFPHVVHASTNFSIILHSALQILIFFGNLEYSIFKRACNIILIIPSSKFTIPLMSERGGGPLQVSNQYLFYRYIRYAAIFEKKSISPPNCEAFCPKCDCQHVNRYYIHQVALWPYLSWCIRLHDLGAYYMLNAICWRPNPTYTKQCLKVT